MTKWFRHEGDYPRSAAAEILEFVDTNYENSRLGRNRLEMGANLREEK